VGEAHDESLRLLIELARPTSHDTVLDYASSAGMAGFALAPQVHSVVAVDELPDLLDEGRRLADELGLHNVSFELVDLYALPHEEGTFPLVVCHDAFPLLPEPGAALRELRRVISGGGRVVILDPMTDDVTDKALNDLARLRQPAHRRYYRAGEIEELAAKAGLRARHSDSVRRTVNLDYWLQTAAVPPAKSTLIHDRFKELPVPVQAAMDIAFSDRLVSFSYDLLGLRLEPV
jgi:SAM-dependent methyltransferase